MSNSLPNNLKFLISYEVSERKFACGQIIGADGCGSHARLICGDDIESCHNRVNSIINSLEKNYNKVKYIVVPYEEGYLGHNICTIDVEK